MKKEGWHKKGNAALHSRGPPLRQAILKEKRLIEGGSFILRKGLSTTTGGKKEERYLCGKKSVRYNSSSAIGKGKGTSAGKKGTWKRTQARVF